MRYRVLRIKRWMLCVLGIMAVGAVVWSGISQRTVYTATTIRKIPIYSVKTEEKKVALGINCAWGDEDIGELLTVLAEHNVKASFFVTGTFCKEYPESVRALYEAGHEIQSHSNTHTNLTTLERDGILEQIRKCNEKIERITGVPATLFRPPSGAYNELVIELIEQEGMYPIQWDCDSLDYKNPSTEEMCRRILSKLQPGSITLFHSGTANTAKALPELLERVKKEGYEWVTVSELIYPRPYTLDHEGRQSPG